jgi:TetR/AcrR family transcriptional repressor of nem operon
MTSARSQVDRKEQIVAAAIDRLSAVGFEGFRLGDIAKDVGINNATLLHHYPSKIALINAVVERFTTTFEGIAEAGTTTGTPQANIERHVRSCMELMQTDPKIFVVLNEIMTKAQRDADIARLVCVPLNGWKRHIVSLILSSKAKPSTKELFETDELATACIAQLLGIGLLFQATHQADARFASMSLQTASQTIAALTRVPAKPQRTEGKR